MRQVDKHKGRTPQECANYFRAAGYTPFLSGTPLLVDSMLPDNDLPPTANGRSNIWVWASWADGYRNSTLGSASTLRQAQTITAVHNASDTAPARRACRGIAEACSAVP